MGSGKTVRLKLATIGIFLLATVVFFAHIAEAEEPAGRLVVIVNLSNPVTHLAQVDLYDIYLGKRRVWAAGGAIMACDLAELQFSEEMTARARFADKYLNKDLRSLKSYWIKMIFSGRGQPPMAFGRPEEVIRFVSANKSAIGYIYESQVTEAVKVVPVAIDSDRP